ncbi:hypothetical protein R1flu_006716 [Riccia fluitans]|uniref:Uncharacterized protein n=1 Tax=Riccia fluitans TaxID=41844 RepID=A0ABD1YWT1_9MARC
MRSHDLSLRPGPITHFPEPAADHPESVSSFDGCIRLGTQVSPFPSWILRVTSYVIISPLPLSCWMTWLISSTLGSKVVRSELVFCFLRRSEQRRWHRR